MRPPGAQTALAVLVSFSCLGSYHGYTIAYYDCHDIDHVNTYQIDQTCKDQLSTQDKAQLYTILQKASVQTISGWSCQVKRSRFTDYCGKWGHAKHVATPEIELSLPMSSADCLDLIATKTFITPQGIRRAVKIGAENILSIEELGAINVGDDTIGCTGESLRVAKGASSFIIKDVLQIAQYKVIVKEETFLVDSDDRVEAAADHLRLPLNCNVWMHGCKLHDLTYVWQAPQHRCPMEAVRTVSMRKEGDFLRSNEFKILLKPGDISSAPEGCPRVKIKATQYDNLFITKPNDDWPAMTNDLDFNDYVRERDDYVIYTLERKIAHVYDKNREAICAMTIQKQGTIKLEGDNNVFYRRNGDTVERFECPLKTGQLASSLDTCYHDIPLADNAGFVKPDTRLYTTHSAPMPCNKNYGLKIKTKENVWVEFNPDPRQITTPSALPVKAQAFEHEDLSSGGLYTDLELNAWKRHLELGDLHDAVVKTITYGHCANTGECAPSPGIPQSNLKFISAEAMMLHDTWNFAGKIDEFLRAASGYLSAIVILLETIKFLNFMAAIAITTAKDGIQGCKALIYSLCCHPHNMANRIVRRHRRLDRAASCTSDDATEMLGISTVTTKGAGCNDSPPPSEA